MAEIRQRLATMRAKSWQLGTLALKGAPAEVSEAVAARRVMEAFGDGYVEEMFAARRFVLTGDLQEIDEKRASGHGAYPQMPPKAWSKVYPNTTPSQVLRR